MISEDKVRYSIYMDAKLAEYVESEVKRLGISKSGFFSVLVSNDKMSKEYLSATNSLSQVKEMLQELKVKVDK